MWTEFKHTLFRRLRGQLLGWSIGLGLYAVMMIAFYPSVIQLDIEMYLDAFPQEMFAFIGSITMLSTPPGYLESYFFNYMPFILGILAANAGASLLVADEERGILDLILAHPISRAALFYGRWLALVAVIAIILLISWMCWAIPGPGFGMDLTWFEFLLPFIGLFAVLLLFAALALLLSQLLPSARMAGMLTAALAIGNYLLVGLANLDDRLEVFVRFTPLHYYEGGLAVEGLNWGWVAGHLAVTLVLVLAAWTLFQRREIRVGGERTWQLPNLARLFSHKA